ncbi:MAG TPA: CAP domain-containing protein [Gaiellaceae bacterium]
MRGKLIIALAVVAVCGGLASQEAATSPGSRHVALTSLESGVLSQLNQIRAQYGLKPVQVSARLTASAQQHSNEMAADGYFEHTSADGTAFWKRIDHWYSSGGYRYWSVGENLLWSSPDVDPAHALQLWMASPEHRSNILAARWREIGVAAVHADSAPGTFGGLPVTIITTDFGVRR